MRRWESWCGWGLLAILCAVPIVFDALAILAWRRERDERRTSALEEGLRRFDELVPRIAGGARSCFEMQPERRWRE